MDDKRRKEIIFFMGSVLVAVIFLTSYVAFGGISTSTATTTQQANQSTFFAIGAANAIVVGYSDAAGITLSDPAYSSEVSNSLNILSSNGILTNVVELNSTYSEVFFQNTSKYNAYDLQQYIYNSIMSNTIAVVNATTLVSLPRSLVMSIAAQKFTISIPKSNYSLQVSPLVAEGTLIPVNIHALVTQGGTIYEGQITLTKR